MRKFSGINIHIKLRHNVISRKSHLTCVNTCGLVQDCINSIVLPQWHSLAISNGIYICLSIPLTHALAIWTCFLSLRYLYVNSRPWPQGYVIDDPLSPPPIAQEIDIHVIDLVTIQEVGTMHRAHKAYTPNDECFFIFLDVCDEYVSRLVGNE